jgi:hypothetical protein
MTLVKSSYSSSDQMTWEQAAFKSAEELWERYNTYKDFSIKPYLDLSISEIENLRNAIDNYINSDLYLQKIQCLKDCSNGDRGQHKFLWYALTSNAIRATKTFYPEKSARLVEVVITVINKQKDYGHHNIAMFGITGLVIRIHDKIARAENLLQKKDMENAVPGESLYDTFIDIIGYSIIALMWLDNTFMLKLGESK